MRNALDLIADALLPGDPALGMPCASQVGLETYMPQHGAQDAAAKFVRMIEELCERKFGMPLTAMDPSQRLQAFNAAKLVDIRLFAAVVTHLLKAYYTAPDVLHRLHTGSVPPFPQGNSLANDDWTLLEPVFERGRIHREIPQEDQIC